LGNELAGIATIRVTASAGSSILDKSFTFTADRGAPGTIACASVGLATSGYVNRFLVRFVGTTFGEQFRVKFGSKANLVPGHYCNAFDNVTSGLTNFSSLIPVDLGSNELLFFFRGGTCVSSTGFFDVSAANFIYPNTGSQFIFPTPSRFLANFTLHCDTDKVDINGTLDFPATRPARGGNRPDGVTASPGNAPTCAADDFGSGKHSPGGGSGGSGGGSGGVGGTAGISAFPDFTGFGNGAKGGGGGSGTTPTPGPAFLNIDIGFDTTDGTPTFDTSGELDLPLNVVSSGLKDNVTLSASSDPEGLDFAFDTPTLPPNNDFAVPFLIIHPQKDAAPRDYLVTVTATSGDTTSSTSFLVSLACDPPFISSMATSQPQSQTITIGQTATLAVSAIGSGPFSYQWYRGTTGNTQFPVDNATSRTFTTPALQSTETYWVRVSNGCGTADSNAATITVH
jgi:hypothetical protein